MAFSKKDSILKNGIWMKKEDGLLIMGVLDDKKDSSVVLSKKISDFLFKVEADLEDSLYGGGSLKAETIKVKSLFDMIEDKYSSEENCKIEVHYDLSHEIRLVINDFQFFIDFLIGLSTSSEIGSFEKKVIYINGSVINGNLSMVYRDSQGCSGINPESEGLNGAVKRLGGEVKLKGSGEKSYLDIMIPSKAD